MGIGEPREYRSEVKFRIADCAVCEKESGQFGVGEKWDQAGEDGEVSPMVLWRWFCQACQIVVEEHEEDGRGDSEEE